MNESAVPSYLNKLVATQGLFYIRLHQFHWYVKGPNFFALHEKFEELYDEVTEQLDEVAERLLAIGGEPYSTLTEYVEHAIIKESPSDKSLSQEQMVEALLADFDTIRAYLVEGITLTAEEGDDVTNDMLIEIKGSVDKTMWMLRAVLGR